MFVLARVKVGDCRLEVGVFFGGSGGFWRCGGVLRGVSQVLYHVNTGVVSRG